MSKTAPTNSDEIFFFRMSGGWDGTLQRKLAECEMRSAEFVCEHWRPKGLALRPRGARGKAFPAYSVLSKAGVFGRHYGAITLRDASGALHHASMVVPRYARFPFMSVDDVQIGATWTNDTSRGRGLATRALLEAGRIFADGRRSLWYLCEADNIASRKVAERAGFRCVGRGRKLPRLGSRLLGFYQITQPAGTET